MNVYEKVIERIAAWRRNLIYISQVQHNDWERPRIPQSKKHYLVTEKGQKTSGVYCLKTNCNDLNEQQIWDVYTMLTDIEDAFRCMKSELGLRPIYHRMERRCDGHIFMTLLAYHILYTIRFKLRQRGVRFCWATVPTQLSSQNRISTTMKQKGGKAVHLRKSSRAELSHRTIYGALSLSTQPGRLIKTIL